MGEKKMVSDLEKMKIERAKAENEYMDGQQQMLEIRRIMREGITNVDELVLYVADVIQGVTHVEDLARASNNAITYSEAVGIRREFTKLLELVLEDGSAMPMDGTEEKHRENNEGEEGYQ